MPRVFVLLAGASYPFLVYAAFSVLEPRVIGLLVVGAVVLRVAIVGMPPGLPRLSRLVLPGILFGAVLAVSGLVGDGRVFMLVPTAVNAVLLLAFARTLRHGPPMIEVFARRQGYEPSLQGISYCRTLTAVWCGLFIVNGGVALWLALYASVAAWTFYTGVLSYVFVGLLLGGEHLYRHWRFPNRNIPALPSASDAETPADPSFAEPELMQEVVRKEFAERTLRVPEGLGCLQGHFPGVPIVPAVVQIQWVIDLAQRFLGPEVAIERAAGLKFKAILRPGDVFQVRVELTETPNELHFRLWNTERLFSVGRCHMSPPRTSSP